MGRARTRSLVNTRIDCAFCALVQVNPAPGREVWRTESVLAFFPDEPASVGHTLIIPNTHVAHLWNLSDAIARDLAVAVTRVAKAIHSTIAPEGLNVIQSNGRVASQTVDHLHIHLVPRSKDDAIGDFWPTDVRLGADKLDAAQRRLSYAIGLDEPA